MDEAQLLQDFRLPERKQAAFRKLLDGYQGRIYAHLYRMVGQAEDAADLTQEVFVRVWKNLDGFEGRSKLYTWIYRIATNEALALLEKRKRFSTVSLDEEHFRNLREQAAGQDMDGEAIEKLLQRALDTLPPKQRQVFLLRYYDEMPYADMSQVLQTSEGALKASYHHAVRKIQECLIGPKPGVD